MKKLTFVIILLGLLFFGCVENISTSIDMNDDGSGKAVITFKTMTDYDDEVQEMFGNRQNFRATKTKDTDDNYHYNIYFDINKPSDITFNSKFTKSFDDQYSEKYTYHDLLSFEKLTGMSDSVSDFEYCMRMPNDAKIISLSFNGINDNTQVGMNIFCVEVDGSSSNTGEEVIAVAGVKRIGCSYNNPSCDNNHNCVDNQCVLKDGCSYNNPPCNDFLKTCNHNRCGYSAWFYLIILLMVGGVIAGIYLLFIKK
ncbi:hypothetical protein KJ708_06910 [bacterium]|nr:hypothetical protein [bacterium]MBU1916668.1 hypothetical protein [bacterium]